MATPWIDPETALPSNPPSQIKKFCKRIWAHPGDYWTSVQRIKSKGCSFVSILPGGSLGEIPVLQAGYPAYQDQYTDLDGIPWDVAFGEDVVPIEFIFFCETSAINGFYMVIQEMQNVPLSQWCKPGWFNNELAHHWEVIPNDANQDWFAGINQWLIVGFFQYRAARQIMNLFCLDYSEG